MFGTPNTISREGAGRQGATSESKESTQHASGRQHSSHKEDGVSGFYLRNTFVVFEMPTGTR